MSTLSLNVALERPGFALQVSHDLRAHRHHGVVRARAAPARRRCCASSRASSETCAARVDVRRRSLAKRWRPRADAPTRDRLRISRRPAVPASERRAEPAIRPVAQQGAPVDRLRRSRGSSRSPRPPLAPHAFAVGRRATARRDRARAAAQPAPHADGRAAVLARRRAQERDRAAHRKAAGDCSGFRFST